MKETTNKNKTKTKKTSSYVKKDIITQLSDEELLEQILKKNKEKKAKRKTYAKKTGVVKSTKVKKKVTTSTIDDSLLLDEILKKNKEKKARAKKRKLSKGRLLVDSNTVENKIVKEILDQEEKEKDLIITKEINLKEYLEEQKRLEQREDLKQLDEEITPKQEEKKQQVTFNTNKVLVPVMILLVIFTIGIVVISLNKSEISNAMKEDIQPQVPQVDNYKAIYDECMNQPLGEIDNSEQMVSYTQELNSFLTNYSVSVYYYDLNKGFNYTYNGDEKYYAASVVKTIPAMYLYEKAINGEVNLDDTIVYSSRYNYDDSAFFDNTRYGTSVTIRDIIKYAIFYSDNTAYMMLLDYAGVNNLKSYAQSLGINSYMDTDKFGHITAYDGYLMFNKLNDIINNGGELGEELRYYFVNSDHNDLMIGEYSIMAATKYGEATPNFHNVGIVYETHPYIVSILTRELSGDHDQKVRDIARKIYELHLEYYKNRKEQCEKIANEKSTE